MRTGLCTQRCWGTAEVLWDCWGAVGTPLQQLLGGSWISWSCIPHRSLCTLLSEMKELLANLGLGKLRKTNSG